MTYTVEYRFYNNVLYEIMNEEGSLHNIKTRVKADIPKAIWKKYGRSTRDWAEYAHNNGLWYPVVVFQDGIPCASIDNSPNALIIRFLDERLFQTVYMSYLKVSDKQMFLTKIYVREYLHKENEDLHDLNRDITLFFTEKGDLTVTTETIIREPSIRIEREEKEAAHPVNVSRNWMRIPDFNVYEELLDYQNIIRPGDLLQGVDVTLPPPKEDGWWAFD